MERDDDVEVTPEMVRAGLEEFWRACAATDACDVTEVYDVMIERTIRAALGVRRAAKVV